MSKDEQLRRVAANCKRIRGERSQGLIAKLAGFTQSRVSAIERAESDLTIGTIVKLSKALGCTTGDLLAEPEADR